MKRRIDQLLREFREGVEQIYGARLRGAYLYGSYARGDEDRESDVDIVVVLDNFEHYGHEVDRTGKLGADLSLKYEVSISQVFIREDDWLHEDSSFLANVRAEAVPT